MSMQLLPLLVYFLSQKVIQQLGEDVIPKSIASFLPMVIAGVVFFASSSYSQSQAKKKNSKLIGAEAPDFNITLKDKSTSLKQLITDTKLPTVVDFYQTFWPACGPAAQQLDKMAADEKYKGKVNFLLINLKSLEDAEKYSKDKGLTGPTLHGTGNAPNEYGLQYIPHKVLIDKDGLVVKNFDVNLPADLDALLSGPEKVEKVE